MNQHMDVRNRSKLHLKRWKCAGNAVISPPWILSKQNGKGKTEFMLGVFSNVKHNFGFLWLLVQWILVGTWWNLQFWNLRDLCFQQRHCLSVYMLLLWVNRRFWTLCLNLSIESVYLLFNFLLFWWCLVVMEMVCELLADSLTFPWIPYLSIYK